MESHDKKLGFAQSPNKIITKEVQTDKLSKSQVTLPIGSHFSLTSKNKYCIQQSEDQKALSIQLPELQETPLHKTPLEQNQQLGNYHSLIQPQIPIPVHHGINSSHYHQTKIQNTQKQMSFNQFQNSNQHINFFDHNLISDFQDKKLVQNKKNEAFIENMSATFDKNKNLKLYHEFNKLLRTSKNLNDHVKELLKKKKQLALKVSKLEQDMQPIFHSKHIDQMTYLMKDNITSNDNRRKRSRRSANQIPRNYVCSIQTCDRSYGSEASLIQHIKLKHPDLIYVPIAKRDQGSESNSGSRIKKTDKQGHFNHESWGNEASFNSEFIEKRNNRPKSIGKSPKGQGKQNQRQSVNADGYVNKQNQGFL